MSDIAAQSRAVLCWWIAAGRATIHCVLRNAASHSSLETQARRGTVILHAWWTQNGPFLSLCLSL